MGKRIELLIIDPQNDFCDPKGSLYVEGANEDMKRLAKFIDRVGDKLYDIHVTLDSHRMVDVAHPIFWEDSKGNPPDPFTIITFDDVQKGIWKTRNPGYQVRSTDYVRRLEENGRYPLCIWPPHCLIGSWGHNVYPDLFESLLRWEEKNFANIDFVTKGSNPFTEHYSAVQADVPDPTDPTTQLNSGLINQLQDGDIDLLAGVARSHCLANTVRDIANKFDKDGNVNYVKKFVLLTDATSDVADLPGSTMFKDMGDSFVKDMCALGMQLSTTEEFLS